MLIGKLRHFTSTRSPFHKTFLDQERFIHFLNSARIFAQSGSNGCQTDRTAFKLVYDGAKYLVVYLIQTILVDIQRFQRKLSYFRIDRARTFTCAKSRTRRSKALAIRGVPRLRDAISDAARTEQGTSSMDAERRMILLRISSS